MAQKKEIVFVVMSFDPKYFPMFTLIQAIAAQQGAEAVRADEPRNVIRKIRPDIFSKIRKAVLIVAEISAGSANVLYEVGWAHAMGKPTMLIAEEDADIPFDLNDYPVVKYDPKMSPPLLHMKLKDEFDKHLAVARQTVNLRQPLVEVLGSIEEVASRNDLFTHLLGRSIDKIAQESKQWIGDSIRVGRAEAIEKGIEVFKRLKHGGFATYLVPLEAFWETDDKYKEECRLASQMRGVKIERVFILPSHEALFSDSLRDHVKRDEAAGIRTFIAFVDNVPEKDAIHDFGIWDEELLCLIEVGLIGGQTEVRGGMFARDKLALSRAGLWKEVILSASQPAPDLLKVIESLDEDTKLLLSSADNMRQDAHQYCRGSYLTAYKSSCEWYHAAWQYLRILGLVSTPDWHTDFYAKAFGEAFGAGVRDILISGTADYAIVHHLAKAIPKHLLQSVIITVIDICETSLRACTFYDRWYESKFGVRLNLRHARRDALDTGFHDKTFDLVTSDAFLTRFEETEQKRVVSEWYRILKPGGRVITTTRLSRGKEFKKVVANEGEIEDFIIRVKKHVQTKKPWLRPTLNTLCNLAREYARNIVSYPLPSEEYIHQLFSEFNCVMEIGVTSGEFEGATEYARIVAIKR